VISKKKLSLSEDIDIEKLLEKIKQKYSSEKLDIRDGVRIDFKDKWVQLRKSNTEAVLRIYAEARETSVADDLIQEIIKILKG
jgi:phosphomannomutase